MSNRKALEAETIGHKDNPYNYNEAMNDVEANLYKWAMNIEMESMGSNQRVQSEGSWDEMFARCLTPFMD